LILAKVLLEVTDIEFVDKELQLIEKREADIVALCRVNGIKAILHLEIQNSNDKTMHRRMLRYYNDIKIRFESLRLYQFVVYIGKPKLSMSSTIVEDNLNFSYNLIDMHTIDCEKFLTMDTPDALVLAILCDFKGKNEKDVVSCKNRSHSDTLSLNIRTPCRSSFGHRIGVIRTLYSLKSVS
jgi:hypothetical protein